MRKQEATHLQQAADPDACADIDRRLRTAHGVRPIVAATVIAELPEFGQLDRRSIAAFAGLAPVARDSGRRSGPRSIGGGRPIVQAILYLAALQTSRRSAAFIRLPQAAAQAAAQDG